MQYIPLPSLTEDRRVPVEIKGGPNLEEALGAARLRQIALEGALGQASLTRPSAEEMQRRQPEIDANLASLPDEKRMVLAGITQAILQQQN